MDDDLFNAVMDAVNDLVIAEEDGITHLRERSHCENVVRWAIGAAEGRGATMAAKHGDCPMFVPQKKPELN